jgi:hypothetical protein
MGKDQQRDLLWRPMRRREAVAAMRQGPAFRARARRRRLTAMHQVKEMEAVRSVK